LLATVFSLLRDELDGISPEITARVERDIEILILSPYLDLHFWWMGRGEERMNNWTAWISQNFLLTIQSFKVFDQIYMITQGGPGTSKLVL
ncbi:hypothetical protein ACC754_39020, partial [Rhizobium johnstonii]